MKLNNNKQLSLWMVLALLFSGVGAWAQGSIKGKVTDKEGNPLVGASVVIAQASLGVMSGDDGSFLLKNVPAGDHTLDVFYLGYNKLSQPVTVVNGQTAELNFALEEEALATDEVVVVGYGVQRRREVVGNITKLNGDDVKPQLGSSFETGLQGKTTGLQVIQGSGTVGAASTVRLRGTGSITAAGDPLYIVDGIPITQNYNNNQGLGSDVQNNPLQFINSNDIESIEVLKDASAIAIYGSRGANGVIIITTKRGKTGKPQFNVNINTGAGKPTVLPEMLNSTEWLQIQQEAWENMGNAGLAPLPTLNSQQMTLSDIKGINTNWYDQVLRTSSKQDYSASIKYGTAKYQIYSGVTYSNQQGFQIGNGMNRLTARANIDYSPMKGLKASLNASFSGTNTDKVNQQYNGPLGYAMSSALPIYPVTYDPLIANALAAGDTAKAEAWKAAAAANDNYVTFGANAARMLAKQKWQARETRPIVNASVTYSILSNLHLNATYNGEFMDLWDYQWRDSTFSDAKSGTKRVDKSQAWNTRFSNQSAFATATYDVVLPKDHTLKIMAGTEGQMSKSTTLYREYLGNFSANNFLFENEDLLTRDSVYFSENPFDTTIYNPTGGFTKINNSFKDGRFNEPTFNDQWYFLSFFARANYAWKNKLFAQLTFRRDGSSKYGANHRFGNFPSIGVGYVLTEEEFLKGNKVINYLKLRTSWGITGNSALNWTEQYAQYKIFGQNGYSDSYGQNNSQTRYQAKVANPNLRWETANTFDIGFDYGLFSDRISGDFTYYYKRTSGALIGAQMPLSAGFDVTQVLQNTGVIDNWGVEFGIKTKNIVMENFSWKTDFNISHNNNIVRSNGGISPDALDGGYGDLRVIEGYPVSTSYIHEFVRVDPVTGRPVYLDKDGEETFVYDELPRVGNRRAAGSPLPLFYGSLGNNFTYKKFDLSFQFYFSYGGQLYDDAGKFYLGVIRHQNDAWNYRRDILDHWTPENTDAKYPKLTTTIADWGNATGAYYNNNSTLWFQDASYIRLRSISLGYNIAPKGKLGPVNNMRIAVSGNNLITLSRTYGLDPETARFVDNAAKRNIGGAGNSYLNTPQEKSLLLNLNINF